MPLTGVIEAKYAFCCHGISRFATGQKRPGVQRNPIRSFPTESALSQPSERLPSRLVAPNRLAGCRMPVVCDARRLPAASRRSDGHLPDVVCVFADRTI
jgi:hypothetical protein